MLQPGTRLGNYEVLAPLGAGGMGEVYRARDHRLGRDVAIKVLPREFATDAARLARFEREARAVAALSHPNILAIYDVGSEDGVSYAVMELLEGETLRERLKEGGLPPRRAIEFATQIATGLAAAHEKGIVHRDLKPENLFVTTDGRIKILDFGLAKMDPVSVAASADVTHAATMTEAGTVLGTSGYMSPEQVRGRATDHRADIFSFGAILYELLSGRRAFQGESAAETMSAIAREEPPELSTVARNISPGLERVVRRCLEKSPELRFQSARDLAFHLEALSSGSSTPQPAPVLAPKRRRGAVALAVAAAALLLIASVAYLMGRRSAERPQPVFQRITFQRGVVLSARYAPDAQTILYTASWKGEPYRIFTARAGSPESSPLPLPPARLFSISRSGELAIGLNYNFDGTFKGNGGGGTLARVALTGGAPRAMLEGVQEAEWSPDGSELAVVRFAGGQSRLEFPPGNVLYTTNGWVGAPRFSPDGKRIALMDHVALADDRGQVVVVDLSGNKTVLAGNWTSMRSLAWSPDGREIWFDGGRAGMARALHAVSLDGKTRELLRVAGRLDLFDVARDGRLLLAREDESLVLSARVPGAAAEVDLSWLYFSIVADIAPDGGSVLMGEISSEAVGANYAIYLRKSDGSPAVRLGEGWAGPLSPDGKFAISLPVGDGQITLLPTGAGEVRRLPAGNLKRFYSAAWLPGGGRIVLCAAEASGHARLYVQDIAGGTPAPFSEEGVVADDLAPHPDGTLVAATGAAGGLYLYPIAGGPPRPLEGLQPGEVPMAWSADGRYLFVSTSGQLPAAIYRFEVATRKRQLWQQIKPSDPSGITGIYRVRITPDGKWYAYSSTRWLSELYQVSGVR